jgi:hypothetical protein
MTSWEPGHPNSVSASDSDAHSIYTPTETSSPTIIGEHDSRSEIPCHGSTYIIRAVSSEDVMTLLDGNVVLAPLGTHGSIYWTCIEKQGWFGFRNCSSHMFICHDGNGRLRCTAQENSGWRQFTVTPLPKGGYIMQMLDWWTLRPIVINPEKGLQKLGRTGDKMSEGVVWEFLKVEEDLSRV